MAFDLVRLQILQEALAVLKEGRCLRMIRAPERGICGSLAMASMRYAPITGFAWSILSEDPYIKYALSVSVKVRQSCDALDTLEGYEASFAGYLWPLTAAYRADRVKYIERLIEDEISGTYFMEMNRGF